MFHIFLIALTLVTSAFGGFTFTNSLSDHNNTLELGALSILKPSQGGTGVGTATAGDVGKVLKVSNDNPFTYTLQTDNTGGGGWTGSNWLFTAAQDAITPSTTVGVILRASSTLSYLGSGGVGANNGRLYAGATTTYNSPLNYANGAVTLSTSGAWSGTAGALAADGTNCSAGNFPLGVDTLGAVQDCTDAWTQAENTSAAYISDGNTLWDNSYGFITWPFIPTTYGNSTTSVIAFSNGLISGATTTISYLGTGGVGTNNGRLYNAATTTFSSGITYLNGNATADLGTSIDLASGEVTGDLPFSNIAQLSANTVWGNRTSATADGAALATSTQLFNGGTPGQVLMWNGAGYYPFSTTTFSAGSGIGVSLAGNALTISNTGVLTTRNINTTYPIQGGGDLSADRTITTALSTTTNNIWSGTNIFANGSTTIVGNATTSGYFFAGTASSSLLFGGKLSECSDPGDTLNWNAGVFSCGTDAEGAGGAFPFVPFTWGNSTSTVIRFTEGLISNASTTFSQLGTGGVGVNNGLLYNAATTTFSSGLTYLNGNVTSDLGTSIDLSTAEVTGDLPFANLAQVAANSILGNRTSATADAAALATTTQLFNGGTPGQVLMWNGAGYYPFSTTTFVAGNNITLSMAGNALTINSTASGGAGNWFTPQTWGNSTSTVLSFPGFISTASSTLSHLGSGGLGVNNGLIYNAATTTFSGGLSYLNGNVTDQLTAGDGLTRNTNDFDLDIPVLVSSGGTNATSFTGNQILYTDSAGTTFKSTASSTLFGTATAGQVWYYKSDGTWGAVATSTISAGTGISIAATGNNTAITNSGVISNSCSSGVTCSGTNPSAITLATMAQGVLTNNSNTATIPTSQATSTLFGANITPGFVLAASNGAWTPMATATCLQITGSAGLCDGNDATGGAGGGDPNEKWATTTEDTLAITPNSALRVGIGTTTPKWALQIASSTGPQLALSDGSLSSSIWTFRNINSTLHIGTSSPNTFATSTVSAIQIGSTGPPQFSLGSSSPVAMFSIHAASTTNIASNLLFAIGSTSNTGASTTLFAISNKGDTSIGGIGTSSALFTISTTTAAGSNPIFSVQTSANGATSTVGFFIATSTFLTGGVGFAASSSNQNTVMIGGGVKQANVSIHRGNLCVDNDGFCLSTTTATGRISARQYSTGGTDLAEIYISNDNLEPGDIVETSGGITVVSAQNANRVLGVVSTAPGLTLGLGPDDAAVGNKYEIGLVGRVPTKVNNENGIIRFGDRIALSSQAGIGRKAYDNEASIGITLTEPKDGVILMFLDLQRSGNNYTEEKDTNSVFFLTIIGLLFLGFLYQQRQIRSLRK